MEKADAQSWNTETQIMQFKEEEVREHLTTLMHHYNQSEGLHTLQVMYGCELRGDGSKGGYYQYAYDGRDFISLDKETLTWVAADVQSQILKRRWDLNPLIADFTKAYLEETCIEWLKKNLDNGKETLLRSEPPVGKVTRRAVGGGYETLICQAHGIYPKEIDTTWRKGEEILEHETFRRNIAPNSDGTYHTWISIEIDPKERDLYRCHMDHASLPEPLVLAFKEPGANMIFIVGATLGILATVVLVPGSVFFIRK
ncbi:LOW QUALITY PROTEIN: major histocompatibility complex class I-related gene protein-like [Sceloporus undulatus]|uniref:LOW QUALITY PROTEIN: major histocompatibility complex class I-related gene protein-like n=1 Tax=Sceloporus undulatus TaxID=8520 RepID=UPI001C4D627B|nr:LOW QUALITY PROTEIN: major histocompatibility complex class I-related gene protein-like [Sceloporus undulatus]